MIVFVCERRGRALGVDVSRGFWNDVFVGVIVVGVGAGMLVCKRRGCEPDVEMD